MYFVLDSKLSRCQHDYFRNEYAGKVEGTKFKIGAQSDEFPTFVEKSLLSLPSYILVTFHLSPEAGVSGTAGCVRAPPRFRAQFLSLIRFHYLSVLAAVSFSQVWLFQPIEGSWWAASVPADRLASLGEWGGIKRYQKVPSSPPGALGCPLWGVDASDNVISQGCRPRLKKWGHVNSHLQFAKGPGTCCKC